MLRRKKTCLQPAMTKQGGLQKSYSISSPFNFPDRYTGEFFAAAFQGLHRFYCLRHA
jgi:hypothetical protein